MDKRLEVRRIYVDSRFRLPTSRSTSDFDYELPETLDLPADVVAYVTEFTCVNSWDTLDVNNNKLYLRERIGATYQPRIVEVPQGTYDSDTLQAALQTALNTGALPGLTYTVARSTSTVGTGGAAPFRYYTVTSSGGEFALYSKVDMTLLVNRATWLQQGGPDYDVEDLRSIEEVLRFPSDSIAYSTSKRSHFIDLRSRHSLYLHSQTFGSTSGIGPNGTRSIIMKCPVHASYGNLVIYEHPAMPQDYLEVNTRTLRRMSFRLADAYNHTIDLNGGHMSFTILLAPI